MTEEQKKKYWHMHTECWNFFRDFCDKDMGDMEVWRLMNETQQKIAKKYGDSKLIQKMLANELLNIEMVQMGKEI